MKRYLLFSFAFICFTINWSCTKYTYDQALPSVQFVSAKFYGNDSVQLTGKVTNIGASPIDNVGFAYDEQPAFDILVNQIGVPPTSGQFSVVVRLAPDSTYYIKCFATNDFGYVASANYKYTVPSAAPEVAPCAGSIPANSAVDNKVTYSMVDINYDNTSALYGNVGVETDNGSSEFVNIYFRAAPVNGIYTTITDPTALSSDPNPYDCTIVVNNSYVVNAGGSVYVALGSGGTGTITFCSIPYVAYSTTFFVSGNITY
ncbi:MAG TPA: hypothetical protein VK890_02540 [Bacteroidia bacterium]|jgi:hypothetical protein|nr:hypothetical protein [Bacteroidia bacterium]